jgi:hypothetical protein
MIKVLQQSDDGDIVINDVRYIIRPDAYAYRSATDEEDAIVYDALEIGEDPPIAYFQDDDGNIFIPIW